MARQVMSGRHARLRRPTGGRPTARQIGFAVAGAALAYLAFAAAVGQAFVSINPVIAGNIGIGSDARARLYVLTRQVAVGKLRLGDPAVQAAGTAAFRAEPLNTDALELVALHKSDLKDNRGAERVAELTNRLNRREVGVAMVLFRKSALKGDLSNAVGYIDMALRSTGDAGSVIFGALVPLIRSPDLQRAMVPILDRQTQWVEPFLIYAVDEGGAATEVSQLYAALSEPNRRRLSTRLLARTITRLVDANRFQEAKALLAAAPGYDAAVLTDADISQRTTEPQLGNFGWLEVESPTVTVHFNELADPGTRSATVVVGPGDEAQAMTRILMMPPGIYRFGVSGTREPGSGAVSSRWTISCLGQSGSRPIWSSREGATFRIAADCEAQILRLYVAQTESESDGQLTFSNVSITRQ